MTDPTATPLNNNGSGPKRGRLAPIAVSGLAAVLVLGGALAIPVLLGNEQAKPADSGAADLSAVQKFDVAKPRHVSGKVAYAQNPPVGGNHNPIWLDCGRYAKPVRNEYAVHDLEHGTVWITYRPDLPADDVALLATSLPTEGIMSPYEGLQAPVVVTVWGVQLELSGADDPRLGLFIAEYGDGSTAPEPDADCAGGVGSPLAPAINA